MRLTTAWHVLLSSRKIPSSELGSGQMVHGGYVSVAHGRDASAGRAGSTDTGGWIVKGAHAVQCAGGGTRIVRHDVIRAMLMEFTKSCGLRTEKEHVGNWKMEGGQETSQ